MVSQNSAFIGSQCKLKHSTSYSTNHLDVVSIKDRMGGNPAYAPCVTPKSLHFGNGRPWTGCDKLLFQAFPLHGLRVSHMRETVTWHDLAITILSCQNISHCPGLTLFNLKNQFLKSAFIYGDQRSCRECNLASPNNVERYIHIDTETLHLSPAETKAMCCRCVAASFCASLAAVDIGRFVAAARAKQMSDEV